MKPTDLVLELSKEKLKSFPSTSFSKSCLRYTKKLYGIFLLEDYIGKKYNVKVFEKHSNQEIPISLYIKKFASHIPNLLHPLNVYSGENPMYYNLFREDRLENPVCVDKNIRDIFTYNGDYSYYLTDNCSYNLNYYLGKGKGILTYDTFVGWVFSLLVAIQTLHRLGIWHHDIKLANILVCDSEISKNYSNITYIYDDGVNSRSWTLNYKDLKNIDLKIIDYGDSRVVDDITNSCEDFSNEISIALVAVLDIMWKKVIDKDQEKEEKYFDLKNKLKNCSTTIIEPMFNSKIFDSLISESSNDAYNVTLLNF